MNNHIQGSKMPSSMPRLIQWLLIALFSVSLAACGGGGGSAGAPILGAGNTTGVPGAGSTPAGATSAYQITVTPVSSTVNGGQTTTINAVITQNGVSVPGFVLNFALGSNISGATLSANSATTDANGHAAVNYTAGSLSGIDTIVVSATPTTSTTGTTASASIGSASVSVTGSVGGSQLRIAIASSGNLTSLNGGAATVLTATVTNATGVPQPQQVVSFVLATNISNATLSSATATTATGSGQAGVLYTAGNTNGTDIVTASVKDASGNVATASIPLNVVASSSTLKLTLTPTSATVSSNTAGNGVQTIDQGIQFAAVVTDSNNNTVPNATVTFAMGSVTSSAWVIDPTSTATPKAVVLVQAGMINSSASVVQTLTTTTGVDGAVYARYASGGGSGTDVVVVSVSRNGIILSSQSATMTVS